jgi:hypothetical protein
MPVCVLATESATNILDAFAAVQDEFERLKDAASIVETPAATAKPPPMPSRH